MINAYTFLFNCVLSLGNRSKVPTIFMFRSDCVGMRSSLLFSVLLMGGDTHSLISSMTYMYDVTAAVLKEKYSIKKKTTTHIYHVTLDVTVGNIVD